MKKVLILLLLILSTSLVANQMTALMDDGRLVILNDNGTYEIVKAECPSKYHVYYLDDEVTECLDVIWKEGGVVNVGNYLETTSYFDNDKYTLGEFYLLEINIENPTDLRLEFSGWNDWENPVILGSDGNEYKKIKSMSAYLDDVPYIGDIFDYGIGPHESKRYYQIFDLPKGVFPVSLGVSSIYRKDMKWRNFGELQILE